MKKIALSSLSFTFLLCLILSSCALSSDVVSNKKIQKRKYQKGLFLANKSKKVKKDSKSAEYTFKESNDLDNILDERSNSSLNVGIKEEKSSGKNEKRDCRKETIHQIKHINKLARELANEEKLVKANMSGIETQNKLDTNYEAAILAASSVIKNDLSDLNPHRLKEIEHFFKVYKDLEKKRVDVGGWGDAKEARDIYNACVVRYEESDHKTNGDFTI